MNLSVLKLAELFRTFFFFWLHQTTWEPPVAQMIKNLPAMQETWVQSLGSVSGSGRSPGEENGNPLQYSCQDNPTDRGAWQATVRRVTKSWTWLKRLRMHWLYSEDAEEGISSLGIKDRLYNFSVMRLRWIRQTESLKSLLKYLIEWNKLACLWSE